MTRLNGALPKGPTNGLEVLAQDAISDPETIHTVIARIDTRKISTDIDTGEVEPTMRIREIEVVLPEDDDAARGMLTRAAERRTGQPALIDDLDAGDD